MNKQLKQRRRINEKRARFNRLRNNIPKKRRSVLGIEQTKRLDFSGQMPEKSPEK